MTTLELTMKHVRAYRKQRMRIRAICARIHELGYAEYWSDIVVLNAVVMAMNSLALPYSKNEIYAAFKAVPYDDYGPGNKKYLLPPLLSGASQGSVFSTKSLDTKRKISRQRGEKGLFLPEIPAKQETPQNCFCIQQFEHSLYAYGK